MFLVATTGDGDPPENIKSFLEALELQPSLSHLSVALFGLGSTQYPNFNSTAKVLEKILVSLDAKFISEVVLGDDDKWYHFL